jgi:hypothetical protein
VKYSVHAAGSAGRRAGAADAAIATPFGRLNWDHVERSTGLLADQRHPVMTAGGRFSGLLACYLALHVQELRPGVTWVGELERMS